MLVGFLIIYIISGLLTFSIIKNLRKKINDKSLLAVYAILIFMGITFLIKLPFMSMIMWFAYPHTILERAKEGYNYWNRWNIGTIIFKALFSGFLVYFAYKQFSKQKNDKNKNKSYIFPLLTWLILMTVLVFL